MTVTITGSSGIETAQTGDSDITLDAGTGSQAGDQASTINLKLNGTLKGDISVDEARSGNPLELNTTSTGDVILAMGGGNVGIGAAAPGEKLTVVGDMSVDTNTLYVDSANNRVGIGTASPATNLNIEIPSVTNTSTECFRISDNVLADFKIFLNRSTTLGGSVSALNTAAGIMAFETSNTERARIDASGNCYFGRATYSVWTEGFGVESVGSGSNGSYLNTAHKSGTVSGRPYHYYWYDNGVIGSITQSGTTGVAYNTSSDYRLKENVTELTGAIDRVKQIPVHRFNFIADPDKTIDGFIAHEVSDVVPEAVTGEKDAMRTQEYEVTPAVLDDDGNVVTEAVMGTREVIDPQGIDQSKLVPLLTAALKEAIEEIEALKVRVAALEV